MARRLNRQEYLLIVKRPTSRGCECGGTLTPIWQTWDCSIGFWVCRDCNDFLTTAYGKPPKWLVHELRNDIWQRWQQGELGITAADENFPQTAKNPNTQDGCEV